MKEYSEKTFVAVEVGVQSFDDYQLTWMRRGHTGAQAIKGIERIAAEAGVDTGLHLIFGWPTETHKQVIETARLCNSLPITNVKLHNLHVLEKTPLADMYRSGEFIPADLDLYSERVALFLDHLDPRIAVHRLVLKNFTKFPIEDFYPDLDIDNILSKSYTLQLNQHHYDALCAKINHIHDGFLFSLALHDDLKKNQLSIFENKENEIFIDNMYGFQENSECNLKKIEAKIQSCKVWFEKFITLFNNPIYFDSFKEEFNSLTEILN